MASSPSVPPLNNTSMVALNAGSSSQTTDRNQTKQHLEFKLPELKRPAAWPSTDAKTSSALASPSAPPEEGSKKKNLDIIEHLLSLEQLEEKFSTSVDRARPGYSNGLSADEAERRLLENGPNALTPPPKRHPLLKYLDKLRGLFNLIMLTAGILTYIIYGIDAANNGPNVYIGAILIGVAFLNAFIEWYQERKSQAILESFLNLIPSKATAVRGGAALAIPAQNLVIGDVVYIRMGDKIPADCVIVSATDLKVDNSSLTGESEPQERTHRNTAENPLEATNMVYNGTLCVNGDGYGIVVRTGDNTVIGQIAKLTSTEKKKESPMSEEIEIFVYKIAFVAALSALVFFIVNKVYLKAGWGPAANFAIGTFTAWVPQGLPATVTMLLSIAARRMAQRNVLVKDLQGVETLGAITLLATDKTGTLTRNQMTVSYVWTGLVTFIAQISGATNSDSVEVLDPEKPGVLDFFYTSVLCTKAKFDRFDVPVAQREIFGDATEAGLLRCASTRLPDADNALNNFPKVFEVPFNSENKWALSIHKKQHAKGSLTLYLKGAPERVLRLCDKIFNGTRNIELTAAHKAKFDETYELMASKGHRVLAFAKLELPEDTFPADFEFERDPPNYPRQGLVFQGLVSLEDPPKHGVREAIGHCRAAGVQVMMVTGDHPLTAEAIGRKINLMLGDTRDMVAKKTGRAPEQVSEDEYSSIVIHGERIDGLSETDWINIFNKPEIIFARTSPRHKLEIVKRAQSRGHIVGVTGDGVNDSPALKKADLGIAMNISGSDVSKEAAAMILLDDNFSSTVAGIEEGRLIFQNLKKSIKYIMTHISVEVLASLLYIVIPIPLPLSAIQIIFVDLGFELFNGLSFAFDPPENRDGLMKLQPRRPVTDASIARLDREKARNPAPIIDPETGDEIKPNFIVEAIRKLKFMTTSTYWTKAFEETEEEILVDSELLIYSLIDMGLLATTGAFLTYFVTYWYSYGISPRQVYLMAGGANVNGYFTSSAADYVLPSGRVLTANDQVDALAQGQSAYYMAILFMQIWNMFLVKARMNLPWGKFMLANKYSYPCALFAFAFSVFCVYVPFMNIALGTSWHLSPLMWLIPIGWGFIMWGYTFVRIIILRKLRPLRYSNQVSGLQMFPTRWSTRFSGHGTKLGSTDKI